MVQFGTARSQDIGFQDVTECGCIRERIGSSERTLSRVGTVHNLDVVTVDEQFDLVRYWYKEEKR